MHMKAPEIACLRPASALAFRSMLDLVIVSRKCRCHPSYQGCLFRWLALNVSRITHCQPSGLLRDPGSRISLILTNSVGLSVYFGQPASPDGWSDLDEILQDSPDMAGKNCFLSWTSLANPLLWQPWKTPIFCDSDHFGRHFLRN